MPLLVLMGGFFGFSMLVATKPQTKPAENREITWSVAAQKVAYEIYQPRISAFGELRPRRKVNLRALVSGEVIATSAGFEDGAQVSKGNVLLEIDPFTYENQLADARAQLKGAKAVLKERQAAAKLARQEKARAQKLFKKGTVSQKTVDDKNTDATIKAARAEQQQSAVDRINVQVKKAKRDLANTKVIAPFSGFLANITAREGRVLNPNDQVGVLLDSDNFDVVFNLSDAEYGRFLERNSEVIGRPVNIVWQLGVERIELKAEIERVGAQISQTTRGVDVYARIDGKLPSNLRGGAFVTVELLAQPVPDVMAISKDALYGDNTLYLIENGRLTRKTIADFIDDGAQVLLRSGLNVGDMVLMTRFNEAAPGVAVKVVERP
ncbi:efflux RND transporter periplasmic adaptor subunit [Alphaproteobacteria bacterium]|nr:efflux RND transporter periplasmic adaptor subunit [Alphaproteobacteria bacterium]MDA8624671.1 efflux RND transporter periplasmic adaptor subunit [Alphaproteobacteria bacterium]MDB2393702.1 efflux RND transporter periplasmic adaptor subunit [Alphaproteobacteria bacterium]MDB2431508.1 efflux RND transporter periplasmic adaptor subunit [Alphaproteobacteria bacterium]MDB2488238.1 efflux RND transporter periplasmic adaptor subunit [Alphaproteobacteria bacterium]